MFSRIALSVLTAVVLTAPAAAAQQLEGTWIGEWVRDGSLLEVETTFTRTDSGHDGSFSSDQLRVVDIPFSDIRLEASTVSWSLVGDQSTWRFAGALHGDTIAGHFQDGEATGTFRLVRGASASATLRRAELTFASDDVTLAGTIIYPEGSGPFPAVVFLHGSGAEGRWASFFLARAFARGGVAALAYDKRGVGASNGDWRSAGFEELARDASAAVEAVRRLPDVDPDRVGIHGHSQGGTIAPLVAAENPNVAFVVASAGGGGSMAEIEVYSIGNSIGLRHLTDRQRAEAERYVRTIVATAYEGAPRAQLEAMQREAEGQPWAIPLPPETDHYWSFSRRIASYDPLAAWRRVTVPALLVYGEADERVPPRLSAGSIAEAYLGAGGREMEVVIFPRADHTFRIRPPAHVPFAWPRSAPGYPNRVVDWAREVVRPGDPAAPARS